MRTIGNQKKNSSLDIGAVQSSYDFQTLLEIDADSSGEIVAAQHHDQSPKTRQVFLHQCMNILVYIVRQDVENTARADTDTTGS